MFVFVLVPVRASPVPSVVRRSFVVKFFFWGILFCLAGHHDEILQKPGWPLPCPYLPTYLPTYPTYGKLKKKSLDG